MMAVYEHTYQPYAGQLTPQRSRFLVIPRHAYQAIFQSKLFTGLFALSFVCPLIMVVIIYLHHNASALALLQIQAVDVISINSTFFRVYLAVQSSLGFLLTVLIGPVLISRDLANNALPLYLCRPFSRVEYLLGKASVLVILLSLITWMPGVLLFAFQSYLEGFAWLRENLWIANAIFLSSVLWITVLTLLALALSAWLKWRVVASGALFAVFTIPAAIATMISGQFRTPWSHLFSPSMLLKVVTDDLFRADPTQLLDPWMILPVWAGWVGLGGLVSSCLLLLARKVRAYEVIA